MTDYNKPRSQAYKTLDHDVCWRRHTRIQANESAWCKRKACNFKQPAKGSPHWEGGS